MHRFGHVEGERCAEATVFPDLPAVDVQGRVPVRPADPEPDRLSAPRFRYCNRAPVPRGAGVIVPQRHVGLADALRLPRAGHGELTRKGCAALGPSLGVALVLRVRPELPRAVQIDARALVGVRGRRHERPEAKQQDRERSRSHRGRCPPQEREIGLSTLVLVTRRTCNTPSLILAYESH